MRRNPGANRAPAQDQARGRQLETPADGHDTVAPTVAGGVSGGRVSGSWDLVGLLHDFRAARQRRDETAFGSDDRDIAESEILHLQHQIFDLMPDAAMRASTGHAEADAPDPDDEPAHSDGPIVL